MAKRLPAPNYRIEFLDLQLVGVRAAIRGLRATDQPELLRVMEDVRSLLKDARNREYQGVGLNS